MDPRQLKPATTLPAARTGPLRRLRILAAVAAGLAVDACTQTGGVPTMPKDFPIAGIDVSDFQGDINWAAVARAGTAFAWVRATEGGDRLDESFQRNYDGAAAAGLKRGAYHLWYFCRSGLEQAAWFIEHVPVDPTALPPALDMEWTPYSPTCTKRPPRDELVAEMRAWLTAIEAHYGRRPVIYVTVDLHRERLEGEFKDYHIWVRSTAGHPSLKYPDRKWHFWQYTGTGAVPGVIGKVDQNVFFGSRDQWSSFVAGSLAPGG